MASWAWPQTGKGWGMDKGAMKGGGKMGSNVMSKTIGWLNKSGTLAQPISFADVAGPLAALGDMAAGQLLHELGDSAGQVRDPTAWLLSAANKYGGGGAWGGKKGGKGGKDSWGKGSWGKDSWGKGSWGSDSWGMKGGKGGGWGEASPWISKQIGWLNKAGNLAFPISYNDVAGPLSMIPEDKALALLKELEENAATVKEPSSWLASAAQRLCAGNGKRSKWQDGTGLSKRIGELNKSQKLVDAVRFCDVVGPLSCMPEDQAMTLVDELEQQGQSIKNPTSWLRSAAERGVKKARKGE